MTKNYLIYPCKILRITQNYNGRTSHYPHTIGYPVDYPFDEGCKDAGRDWMYCPCDKMIVKKIFGVAARGTNTVWLESVDKVHFADGTSNYFTMLVTHPNDDDLKKIKVGQTFKRYDKICREGNDGTSGNHLHISAGKGKMKGIGWTQNTYGKWVLTTTGGTYKPEKLFYIDTAFTTVISKGGIAFKALPKSTSKTGYETGKYRVDTELLRVRSGAGTLYPYKKFEKLRSTAQAKILHLTKGEPKDGYVRDLEFTATEIQKNWAKTGSGWVCLDYCEKIV